MKKTTLEKIYISRISYGRDKGKYGGRAEFSCDFGEVEVNLSPELARIVLNACADELVRTSQHVADALREKIEDDVCKTVLVEKDE